MAEAVQYRVISIGALAQHPLWGESQPARLGHATTSLVRSADRVILVDPSLPPEILRARLAERSGLEPAAITDVFLTSFRPDLRRGLALFEEANWYVSEREREEVGRRLLENYQQVENDGDADLLLALREEITLLRRFQPAPDQLAPHVDLFPLPGRSPGSCGLLLALPRQTTLIVGDTIATIEHLEAGQVLADCWDISQAQASFSEAIEIADVLILGRDNLALNPTKRPF